MSRPALFWEGKEGMNFACAWLGTGRVGLLAVDADRSRSGNVVDGIKDPLCRAAAIAQRTSSLLTRKESLKERAAFGRLLLDLGDGRWRRSLGRCVVRLQAGSEVLQLRVFYSDGIDVPDRLLFQRSR